MSKKNRRYSIRSVDIQVTDFIYNVDVVIKIDPRQGLHFYIPVSSSSSSSSSAASAPEESKVTVDEIIFRHAAHSEHLSLILTPYLSSAWADFFVKLEELIQKKIATLSFGGDIKVKFGFKTANIAHNRPCWLSCCYCCDISYPICYTVTPTETAQQVFDQINDQVIVGTQICYRC